MTAGERLHRLREEKNMSMQELADRVNVHKGTVFKWEHDQTPLRKASQSSLEKLAKTLHVSEDFLIYGSDTNPDIVLQNGSSVVMIERKPTKTENSDRLLLYALDILAMQNGFRIDYTEDGDVILVKGSRTKQITEQDLLNTSDDISKLAGMSFRRLMGGES